MVLCHEKFRQRGLSMKQMMFERNGLSIETQRATLLSNLNSAPNSEALSMVVSPTAATTASIITPSISIESSNVEQNVRRDTSPINNSSSSVSNSYEQSGEQHSSVPNSSVLAEHSNNFYSQLASPAGSQSHYVPMYANGNSIFSANNSTPSTIVMTPPSSYGNDIMNGDTSIIHPWHHQMMRGQHSAYSEMLSGEWSNPIGNSSFSSSTNSPLSAYQMSLPNPYSAYHAHGTCRPSGASTIDFYENRFNAPYPHPHYYQNAFFNSTSPPGATNGHFTPLSVGTEVSQMTFGNSSLLNSSPDSGVTLSSEGNESPSINGSHSAADHCLLLGPSLTQSGAAASRNHQPIGNSDLEVDIKPNLASLQSASAAHTSHQQQQQQQEATSTITPNGAASPNGHHQNTNNPNQVPYNWMKKSSNSNSSQSSTGKTRTKDKYRVVYTENQRLELEKEFHFSRYITIRRKAELASQLSLSERQVKIWFQNRRAKDRKQSRKRDEILKKDKNKDGTIINNNNGNNGNGNGIHHNHNHNHHQHHQSSTPGVLVVPNSSSNPHHPNILARNGGGGGVVGGLIHRNHSHLIAAPTGAHQLGQGHSLPGSIAHSRAFSIHSTVGQNSQNNSHGHLHSPPSNLHSGAVNGVNGGGSTGGSNGSGSSNSSSNGSIIQSGYHRELLSASMASSTPTVVSEINH